ncbi:exodeoxyribonuclease III [Pedomonas mirosovicensis]|uniref:exodeoxyribonuclease III n=1 Tax=Pedomonas mirosovicensis TaxID=2908641 RepID=UPI00216A2318|nr:exodeoxyribonuclease III [Pedomonas mirosovicensis]MCH8685193.1 exodeoxyribonuclease III [Pedomonas mirosovicensis]
MRIATFNINGIGARLPRLLEWLDTFKPDVACLQEIKTQTETFPRLEFQTRGYECAVQGQKGFNGVAILSRIGLEDVSIGLPHLAGNDDETDEQSRFIEATVGGDVRVACLYLPNGNPQPGPKFDYKLAWMRRLIAHAKTELAKERPYVLTGDYNVCPTDEDVWDVAKMANDALTQPESRALFHELLWLGFTDAIRAVQPQGHAFTYWDYQAAAWSKDWGLRIDHMLLSPQAADRMVTAGIDRRPRGQEKASDHTPVWCELKDGQTTA